MSKFTVYTPDPAIVQVLEALEFFGVIQNFKIYSDGGVDVTLQRPHEIRARLWEAYAKQHKLTLGGRPDAETFVPPGPPKEPFPQPVPGPFPEPPSGSLPSQGPSLALVLDGNILAVQTALQELAATLTQRQVQELIAAEGKGKNRVTLIRWLENVANSEVVRSHR